MYRSSSQERIERGMYVWKHTCACMPRLYEDWEFGETRHAFSACISYPACFLYAVVCSKLCRYTRKNNQRSGEGDKAFSPLSSLLSLLLLLRLLVSVLLFTPVELWISSLRRRGRRARQNVALSLALSLAEIVLSIVCIYIRGYLCVRMCIYL